MSADGRRREDTAIAIWYDPARIYRYTPEEVAWIIREAWDRWPPQTTGYIDTHEDVDTSPAQTMPGQAAIEVLAEVSCRLERTGEAGKALVWELRAPAMEMADLGHYRRFYGYLSPSARDALIYISRSKRKSISFAHWKWRRYKRQRFT